MATINLQCPFSNTFKCLLQTDNSMTGRAYIGEVLISYKYSRACVFSCLNYTVLMGIMFICINTA